MPRHSHSHRRAGLFAISLVTVLAAGLTASSPVCAQGTSGTLPEPVNTRELSRYADRLQLSPQQRQAADAFHEQYKREFRALREGEISGFLKEMRNLNDGGNMPQRQTIERFIKQMNQLSAKIAAVDNRMFDQWQNVLTPEQLASLPRVRQSRQRQRMLSQQIMMFDGRSKPVDLSEMLLELDASSADRQLVDSTLASYENRLTHLMDKLYDALGSMWLDMYDALAKAGITEESMTDPETAQKVGEVMQNAWADITQKATDISLDINKLNRTSSKTVSGMLPTSAGRMLLHRFWEKTYPEAGFAHGLSDSLFNAAMKIKDLTNEQRESVSAARDNLHRQLDSLVEQVIDQIDEFRKTRSPFDFNSGSWQKQQEIVTEYRSKAAALVQSAVDALKAALTPEQFSQIPDALVPKGREDLIARMGASEDDDSAETPAPPMDPALVAAEAPADSGDDLGAGPDMFIPPAIGQRELADYAVRLQLTEDQRTVMDDVFQTYSEQFNIATNDKVQAVTKAQQTQWNYDETTNTSIAPSDGQIEELYRMRHEAFEAVRGIDAQLFGDIETAVLNEHQLPLMARVKAARDRVIYNRGADMYSNMGGSSESGIDLARLVKQQRLDAAQLADIADELIDYETRIAAAFKTKYESALAMQKAQELWNAQMMRVQHDGGNTMQMAIKYKDTMADVQKTMRQASQATGAINRESLDLLTKALPEAQGFALRNAYNRKAFPAVYVDSVATHAALESALKLADLTDEQRGTIHDLAAEYRVAYAGLSEQMVQASEGAASLMLGMGFEQEDWQKWQERQDLMAKLGFDRNELSLKTLRTLKTTLSESQLETLGGLPEPKLDKQQMWY